MESIFSNEKIMVLDTFFYEEEIIYHVENYLKQHDIQLNRNEIKNYISFLFEEGYIKYGYL